MKRSPNSTIRSIREKRTSLKNSKRVYSIEESCSSDVSDEDSLSEEILFMAIEEIHVKNQQDEDHVDEGGRF